MFLKRGPRRTNTLPGRQLARTAVAGTLFTFNMRNGGYVLTIVGLEREFLEIASSPAVMEILYSL